MASLILQTAIGLTFIFAVFAVAVSATSEAVTRYFGLRAEYLLRGVRSLVDGQSDFKLRWRELMPWGMGTRFAGQRAKGLQQESGQADTNGNAASKSDKAAMVGQIMSHPLVASSAKEAKPPGEAGARPMSNKDRRRLPSYLSGQTFARALIDILSRGASPGDGDPLDAVRRWAQSESAKNTHLARWYKRHVKWVSLGIGLVLVVAFNVNAIKIADALYSDQALSTSVVAEATRASSCQRKDPAQCLADLRNEVGVIRGTGLPIGWGDVPECTARRACSWLDRHGLASIGRSGGADVWTFLLVLLGWAVMFLALLPGARFWFDLLSRLGSLRSTGPKPAA